MTEEEASEAEEKGGYLNLAGGVSIGTNLEYLRRAGRHNYPVTDTESNKRYILTTFRDLESLLANANLESAVYGDIVRHRRRLEDAYLTEEKDEEAHDESATVESEKVDSQDTTSEDEEDGEDEENEEESTLIHISDEDGSRLSNAIDSWEQILKEELGSEIRMPISSSGMIDMEKGLKDPSALFRDSDVWESIPPQTKDDLSEACRTAAMGSSTASVFLSLRSVEERLREWYSVETGRDIEDRTFGQVLGELDDSYDESDRPSLLSHLDYLKDRRNQVAHAEESPGTQEAESTLIMVRETISNIQRIVGIDGRST